MSAVKPTVTGSFERIAAVAQRLQGFPHPWFISDGWAIDLFLGRVTREHSDREVGIFRQDQRPLQEHLSGWALFKAVMGPEGGEYVPWEDGEWLELPIHQILVRPAGMGAPKSEAERSPEEFEFFLNEAADGVWRCRRNLEITRPVEEIYLTSSAGIPILAPEIQLLYKAKGHRPKDDHDFRQALPHLGAERRAWLKEALPRCYGDDPWMAQL